mgnify:CR=1 FL=1
MKSTGIVRKVDELGRIVLPIELRRTLGIEEKDRIEIFVDGESIILRKYQPACIFCDNAKDIINYKGKNICPDCIRAMNEKVPLPSVRGLFLSSAGAQALSAI